MAKDLKRAWPLSLAQVCTLSPPHRSGLHTSNTERRQHRPPSPPNRWCLRAGWQVGARVIVDGAHAAGNLPSLDVPASGADFYVTNLHKWACAPKGAALLWAAPALQGQLLPLTVSHGYGLVRRRLGVGAAARPGGIAPGQGCALRGRAGVVGGPHPLAWPVLLSAASTGERRGPRRTPMHACTYVRVGVPMSLGPGNPLLVPAGVQGRVPVAGDAGHERLAGGACRTGHAARPLHPHNVTLIEHASGSKIFLTSRAL